jgi:hypothetical protein
MIMKYWGFLLLKLVAAAFVMRFVWGAIVVSFRGSLATGFEQKPFGHDLGFTTAMLLYFLLLRRSSPHYLGPALSLPHVLAPAAHASERRVLAQHAVVRTAAHRIHLPLRPWNSQGAGVSCHDYQSRLGTS